jgi:hypothetical protein
MNPCQHLEVWLEDVIPQITGPLVTFAGLQKILQYRNIRGDSISH